MARYFVVGPPHDQNLVMKGIQAKGNEKENSSARASATQPGTVVADLDIGTANHLVQQGAKLYEDLQFQIFDPALPSDPKAHYWRTAPSPMFDIGAPPAGVNLTTVMQAINVSEAWKVTKGKGVTIAIVDTGIVDSLKEVGAPRRSALDLKGTYLGNHWGDDVGHGSMCATIAAGSQSQGGRYDGVAPEATVVAARSDLTATDIFFIYEGLIDAKKSGLIAGPLVISNSYGLYQCSSDNILEQDHPYLKTVLAAIDAGIVVVFAAGNNHWNVKCNFDPTADGPNTIWSINSHDRIISVGTVDRDGSNQKPPTPHVNSSRGPGEWALQHKKPDVVAPTYGEIVWGDSYRVMDWWGTSGACPQVSGLAALLLGANPALTHDQIAEIIRSTAKKLPGPPSCVGAGMIDCGAAITKAAAGA
jgi:subtilisin family serine protease